MQTSRTHVVVLVTAPDLKSSRKLAAAILDQRAAACVNILPRVESHYLWQGKRERGAECLLIIKSAGRALEKLEKAVLENHPYDTPEFIVLPIRSGNARYLKWISDCL
jgi:periplasmic divalent cation tolerance protein